MHQHIEVYHRFPRLPIAPEHQHGQLVVRLRGGFDLFQPLGQLQAFLKLDLDQEGPALDIVPPVTGLTEHALVRFPRNSREDLAHFALGAGTALSGCLSSLGE